MRHVLQEISGEGHCAAYHEALVEQSVSILEIPEPVIEQAIVSETAAGNLTKEPIHDQPALFLTPLYRAEQGVANHLKRLRTAIPPWGFIDIDKAIPWVEEKTGLKLSESQRQAVALAIRNKVTIITGGPGVGKTTVVHSILRIITAKRVRFVCVRPPVERPSVCPNPQGWRPKPSTVCSPSTPRRWVLSIIRTIPWTPICWWWTRCQ